MCCFLHDWLRFHPNDSCVHPLICSGRGRAYTLLDDVAHECPVFLRLEMASSFWNPLDADSFVLNQMEKIVQYMIHQLPVLAQNDNRGHVRFQLLCLFVDARLPFFLRCSSHILLHLSATASVHWLSRRAVCSATGDFVRHEDEFEDAAAHSVMHTHCCPVCKEDLWCLPTKCRSCSFACKDV